MTIITDVYEKIGSVLRELRSNLGASATFTTNEVYSLYRNRYPADEAMMKRRQMVKPGAHDLKGNLNGMVFEYYKKGFNETNRPAIEILDKMTYRFV
jgi:hypothetical protein